VQLTGQLEGLTSEVERLRRENGELRAQLAAAGV
jgi:hypothetical protein